jgi:hypothetical protein
MATQSRHFLRLIVDSTFTEYLFAAAAAMTKVIRAAAVHPV